MLLEHTTVHLIDDLVHYGNIQISCVIDGNPSSKVADSRRLQQ
jgi:hypothetical protein